MLKEELDSTQVFVRDDFTSLEGGVPTNLRLRGQKPYQPLHRLGAVGVAKYLCFATGIAHFSTKSAGSEPILRSS